MIDINELRRLAQAATPGPWHATKSVETNSWAVWSDTTRLMELRPTKTVDMYRVSNTATFIAAANPAAISELLDRLEAAEKAVTEAYQRGYATGQEEFEKERDELRARIERIERQEPVAWIRGRDNHRRRKLSFEKPAKSSPDKFHWSPLYTLPGAQPAPSVPEEEEGMARAALASAPKPDGWQLVPIDSIGKLLTQAMDVAVANGANSASMPDELVEVAAWLSGVQPAPSAPDPKTIRDLLNESGLYAYDRKGDLAFMVAVTKFAALLAAPEAKP